MDYLATNFEKAVPRKKLHIFNDDSLMKSSIPYYVLSLLSSFGVVRD